MLGTKEAMATIAVRDINVAAKFYEGTLGLKPGPSAEKSVRGYKSGSTNILVYESKFAGTNQATAATWAVGGDEIATIAKGLKAKGVVFEHYDMPGAKLEGDVYTFGKIRNAWFKDPDGNILSIVSG